jgi:hypothetical protein
MAWQNLFFDNKRFYCLHDHVLCAERPEVVVYCHLELWCTLKPYFSGTVELLNFKTTMTQSFSLKQKILML